MIAQPEWPKLEPEPEPGRVPQPASEPEADFRPAARRGEPAARPGAAAECQGCLRAARGAPLGRGSKSLK